MLILSLEKRPKVVPCLHQCRRCGMVVSCGYINNITCNKRFENYLCDNCF